MTPGQKVTVTVNRNGKSTTHDGEYIRTNTSGAKGAWVVVKMAGGAEMSVRPVNVKPAVDPLA